jgi:NAD-dependent SIR2 family protein deacetylase
MAAQQNIVYFLGAGCSYNFGYPLTKQIMPGILQRLKEGRLFHSNYDDRLKADEEMEQRLLQYIQLVYPGLDKRNADSEAPNVTEIFSFVDHLCFYDTPHHPALGEERLTDFKMLLNRALGELLQWYEYKNTPTAEQVGLRHRFIESIKGYIAEGHAVTVITTNYDLSVDISWQQEALQRKIDFGIPYRDVVDSDLIAQPENPLLQYYKLHGSLNWLTCSLCGQYYINPIGSIVHQSYRQAVDSDNTCECNNKMRLKTVMVPPSIVRDVRDSNLLQVWKGALESIRHADKLIMIGYSMPAEDLAIKSIILRGINGRNKEAPALDIVQFGRDAVPNYRNIFGDVFDENRYYDKGLEPYLQEKHPALFTT